VVAGSKVVVGSTVVDNMGEDIPATPCRYHLRVVGSTAVGKTAVDSKVEDTPLHSMVVDTPLVSPFRADSSMVRVGRCQYKMG